MELVQDNVQWLALVRALGLRIQLPQFNSALLTVLLIMPKDQRERATLYLPLE